MSQYDLLLTPVNAHVPIPHGFYMTPEINGELLNPADMPPFTDIFSWTGQPAASIPAGNQGRPAGQVADRRAVP